MTEVTVTVRTANGQLVNEPDGIQVSVNPVGNTGGFTTLDDGSTADVNEFLVRLGQGPVDVVAGKATLFLHSLNFSGQTTLTVTAFDSTTNETITASKQFDIVAATPPLPGAVLVSPTTAPQYVQGSGGNTSGQFEILVNDGIGQPVPNPVAGNASFNNLLVEIVGRDGGARLSGVNAAGQSVTGASISIRTTNGVAGAVLLSGPTSGNVLVRATSDRADNNVDNGVSDPVFGQRNVAISDGVPFDVEITSPNISAILINRVDPTVTTTSGALPSDPDGTYSLRVSALVTDRNGNPVIPGTSVQFGIVDDPVVGYPELGGGFFPVSGDDGNPQEGGTDFTTVVGRFGLAQFPVGPNDTLLTLGEHDPSIRDLEGARRVSSIVGVNRAVVAEPFNQNDDSGVSVDRGSIVPYVVGRATDATIVAVASTNSLGVASATINYPVSKLGKSVALWARTQGQATPSGTQELAADVEFFAYAGVGPATLVASPTRIPGNTTSQVEICVFDLAGSPLPGLLIGFSMDGVAGSIDGIANTGVLANRTDESGCTFGTAVTSGVVDGADGSIIFEAAGATDVIEVAAPNTIVLQATPSAFVGDGSFTINLRLLDGAGRPIQNAQLAGECATEGGSSLSFLTAPGSTGSDGRTSARVLATGFDYLGGTDGAVSPTGTCTFTAPGGSATAEVSFAGFNICGPQFSPPAEGCVVDGEDPTDPNNSNLTVAITAASGTQGAGSVVSTPAGITCSLVAGQASVTCSSAFLTGTSISLAATPATGSSLLGFNGGCVRIGTTNTATAALNSDQTCTAIFTSGQTGGQTVELDLDVVPQVAGLSASITSSPSGIFCNLGTASTTETGSCVDVPFTRNDTVTLTAVPGAGTAVTGWAGTCIVSPTNPNEASVVMAGAQSCVVQLGASGGGTGEPATLSVTLNSAAGSQGNGVVTSAPAGIACSLARGAGTTSCGADFAGGSTVRLTAVPNALDGSVFVGWTGACVAVSGQPLLADVVMSSDRTCNATFGETGLTQLDLNLTMAAAGASSGTVTSVPAGLLCSVTGFDLVGGSSSCSAPFTSGSTVTLTATPGAGSDFLGWTGSCIGGAAPNQNQATITMNTEIDCQANFGVTGGGGGQNNTLALTLTDTNGDGAAGSVDTTPDGAECQLASGAGSASCSGDFLSGATVQVIAVETPTSRFVGFNGPCIDDTTDAVDTVATVVMGSDQACTLRFAGAGTITQSFELTLKVAVAETSGPVEVEVGRVVNDPAADEGVQCVVTSTNGFTIPFPGGVVTCPRTFPAGQTVTLRAFADTIDPDDGGTEGTFLGWDGECEATADPAIAVVQITQDKECIAVFRRNDTP